MRSKERFFKVGKVLHGCKRLAPALPYAYSKEKRKV